MYCSIAAVLGNVLFYCSCVREVGQSSCPLATTTSYLCDLKYVFWSQTDSVKLLNC